MILKGNQRAGGGQLATHLLNVRDNDHVEVHEVRGFISDTLNGAFNEAYALSRGTRCKQYLFSLSLNPPEKQKVPIEVFEKAVTEIETKLGLTRQPRAIVFHEKEGRRHAHCVWSRINIDQMKAINLPHYKLKLRDISRQLYLENGWQMPRGLLNYQENNPLNFSLEEWQQAKRAKADPRAIKEMFKECWAVSDSALSFTNALEERGYYLAKGDRRAHLALDWRGEVYALSRWLGLKSKEVRARLGDPNALSSIGETEARITSLLSDRLQTFIAEVETSYQRKKQAFDKRRVRLVERHRAAREALRQVHTARNTLETKARALKLPVGLKALWIRVCGRYAQIVEENEIAAQRCLVRDRTERQRLIESQLQERRSLQHEVSQLRHHQEVTMKGLGFAKKGNKNPPRRMRQIRKMFG